MKCIDCKYFHPVYKDDVKCFGKCRKNAPRQIIAGYGVGESPQFAGDWADVESDDWCGEFESKGCDEKGVQT